MESSGASVPGAMSMTAALTLASQYDELSNQLVQYSLIEIKTALGEMKCALPQKCLNKLITLKVLSFSQ